MFSGSNPQSCILTIMSSLWAICIISPTSFLVCLIFCGYLRLSFFQNGTWKNGALVPHHVIDIDHSFYIVTWADYCQNGCKSHFHGWSQLLLNSLPALLCLSSWQFSLTVILQDPLSTLRSIGNFYLELLQWHSRTMETEHLRHPRSLKLCLKLDLKQYLEWTSHSPFQQCRKLSLSQNNTTYTTREAHVSLPIRGGIVAVFHL